MLRIAIQAKGRLNEDCVTLMNDSGITISGGSRKLMAHAKGFPMDVLYLRDDDIPQAVEMGVADIGIVGLNELEEKGAEVDVIMELGFGECRISLAVPREADYQGLEWFNGRRIATSYPRILRRFLDNNGINAEIHEAEKSVATKTAWRIEGTLREFPKFPPLNLWFDYPVHYVDNVGSLGDICPENEKTPWQKGKEARKKQGEKQIPAGSLQRYRHACR